MLFRSNARFPSKHENAAPALSSPVKEGGKPSLFLAPSEQYVASGIESEGVPVSERGVGDMTASHGGPPPRAV